MHGVERAGDLSNLVCRRDGHELDADITGPAVTLLELSDDLRKPGFSDLESAAAQPAQRPGHRPADDRNAEEREEENQGDDECVEQGAALRLVLQLLTALVEVLDDPPLHRTEQVELSLGRLEPDVRVQCGAILVLDLAQVVTALGLRGDHVLEPGGVFNVASRQQAVVQRDLRRGGAAAEVGKRAVPPGLLVAKLGELAFSEGTIADRTEEQTALPCREFLGPGERIERTHALGDLLVLAVLADLAIEVEQFLD